MNAPPVTADTRRINTVKIKEINEFFFNLFFLHDIYSIFRGNDGNSFIKFFEHFNKSMMEYDVRIPSNFLLLLKKFTETKNTNKLASRQQAKEDTKNVKKTGSA